MQLTQMAIVSSSGVPNQGNFPQGGVLGFLEGIGTTHWQTHLLADLADNIPIIV